MKKKIIYLIPTFFLLFISAYIFVSGWVAAMEAYDLKLYFITFTISVFLNFFYYLWLALTKRISHKLAIFYIPAALVFFVIFIFSIINPPWLKQVRFEIGQDPFSGGATTTGYGTFAIWEKEFWSKSAREEYRLIQFKHVQAAMRGSLIGD